MTVQTKPLSEITEQAIEVLSREIGIAATLRFVNQFTMGYGNYTEEREALVGERTLEEIISAAQKAPRRQNP